MFTSINRTNTYAVKTDETFKKFGTNDVLPLWVADMDLASPKCVQEALLKRAKHPIYGYTVYPNAYYEAIITWNRRYKIEVKKEWIVPCYGVVPSLNFAIKSYSKKNDKIIVQTPLYPPFVSSIKHQKRVVLENVLLYEEGCYRIDFEDFEKKAKDATLFLLCSPHNPSSRAWSDEELEEMITICLKNDVLIVSDEIHADIVYGKSFKSIASFKAIKERCVVFNAPSKSFNIAGLNTSYAIIPNRRLRKKFMVAQNKSGLSSGNPFGIEALIASYTQGEVWLEALKNHLQENIAYVNGFLAQHNLPIKALTSEATFLIWLDCKGLGLSHQDLVNFFYFQAKLGLNEGKSFGSTGEGFMRLNIGTSKEVIQEAMDRLLRAYKGLNQ